MTPDRYCAILQEFDDILDYAKAVSSKLAGRTVVEEWESYADAIFTKLICHGISLRTLSPSLSVETQSELWDVASSCAVARALIEAYDSLAYIALQPMSKSERSFRICLWELHDQQRRLKMLDGIKSTQPQVQEIRNRAHQLATMLATYPEFVAASPDLRSKVDRGDAPPFHLSQRERNAASSVHHAYYTAATMYLSQFVHTLPMSVHQLMNFHAGQPDALHACSIPIQYSAAFLAKAATGMTASFPGGSVEPERGVRQKIDSWLGLLEKGIDSAVGWTAEESPTLNGNQSGLVG